MRTWTGRLSSGGAILAAVALSRPGAAGANWGENWGSMIWGNSSFAVTTVDLPGLVLLSAILVAASAWALRKRRPARGLPLLLVLVAIPLAVVAGTLAVPNTFVNGTTADGDQVNANFDAVETEVNDNDSRIETNASAISTNATNISENTTAASDAASAASAAQTTADSASTAANAAQGTADTAVANAATAQGTANANQAVLNAQGNSWPASQITGAELLIDRAGGTNTAPNNSVAAAIKYDHGMEHPLVIFPEDLMAAPHRASWVFSNGGSAYSNANLRIDGDCDSRYDPELRRITVNNDTCYITDPDNGSILPNMVQIGSDVSGPTLVIRTGSTARASAPANEAILALDAAEEWFWRLLGNGKMSWGDGGPNWDNTDDGSDAVKGSTSFDTHIERVEVGDDVFLRVTNDSDGKTLDLRPTACSEVTYSLDCDLSGSGDGDCEKTPLESGGLATTALSTTPSEVVSGGSGWWNEMYDSLGEWEHCVGATGQVNMEFTRTGAGDVPFHVSCRLVTQSTLGGETVSFFGNSAAGTSISAGAPFAKSMEWFDATLQPATVMVTGALKMNTGDCVGISVASDGSPAFSMNLLSGSCTIRETGRCSQPIP